MSGFIRFLILSFALAIPGICTAADVIKDLDDLPRMPRYTFSETSSWGVLANNIDGDLAVLSDVDGDGYEELICSQSSGFICFDREPGSRSRIFWQYGLPAAWRAPSRGPEERRNYMFLGPPDDLNRDGLAEILFTVGSADSYTWLVGAFDPAKQQAAFTLEIPAPVEELKDGRWDGNYHAIGVLPAPTPTGTPLLIVSCMAGYDLRGRGVMAIEPDSGEIVWTFPTAANPDWHSFVLRDVDGDGAVEIVFVANSPDNMKPHHEPVGGLRDDTCMLFVLKNDGELLWSQRIGGPFFTASVRIGDLDGDGITEIVTASRTHSVGYHDRLCVWSGADGRLLAQKASAYAFWGLAVKPRTDHSGADLYAGSDGGLVHYHYTQGRISLVGRAIGAGRVVLSGFGDFLPESGDELVACAVGMADDEERQRDSVTYFILNESFEILAHDDLHGLHAYEVLCWNSSDEEVFVLGLAPGAIPMVLKHSLRTTSWMVSAAIGAILVVVAIVLASWSRVRRRASEDVLPDRILLDRLNNDLEVSEHGTVAATKELKRVVWLLKAIRAEEQTTDKLRERVSGIWDDFSENGHKVLLAVLHTAERANFRPDLVETSQSRVASLVESLTDLMGGELDHEVICDGIDLIERKWEKANAAMKALSHAVENFYSSLIRKTIERILLLWEDELDRGGVVLECDIAELDADVRVKIYPGDLRFILDNLIGNAVEAMGSCSAKTLTVTASADIDTVTVLVQDSGRGMTEERAASVMARRGRGHGRGLGLWRSRGILNDLGGELLVEETAPEKGTTFSLKLARMTHTVKQEEQVEHGS